MADNKSNIIKESEIKYSSLSFTDPVGRVFFARDRVFRAINPSVEDEVREFLYSDCYRILLERGWLVNTWVTNDVQMSAYPLVLEHEKVHCVRWQLLTMQQLIDAAKLHIQIAETCAKFGYYLFDSGFNNVGIKDGKLCLIDFGSIRKGRDVPRETYAFSVIYIALWLMNRGHYALARSLEPIQYTFDVTGSCLLQDAYIFQSAILPLVKYYRCYLKVKKITLPAVQIRTRFGLRMAHAINSSVRLITRQKYAKSNLLKIRPVYRALNIKAIERFEHKCNAKTYKSTFLSDVKKYIAERRLDNTLVYGEYSFESLMIFKSICKCILYVASPDVEYTDSAYRYFSEHKSDILVLNYTPATNQHFEFLQELHVDTFVVEPSYLLWPWKVDRVDSNYMERIAKFANNVITRNTFDEDGEIVNIEL